VRTRGQRPVLPSSWLSVSRVARSVRGRLVRRGFPIASTALVAPATRQVVSDIYDFAAAHDVPLIRFAKGQRKDDVMAANLAGFTGREGIVFIGVAPEKTHILRTERRYNPAAANITIGGPAATCQEEGRYPWRTP
jgi:hypothetical protein